MRWNNRLIELCLLLGVVGCAETADDPSGPDQGDTAPMVASLRLDNGNELNFYDFGTAGLVTETGAAYTKPVFDEPTLPAGELVSLWQRLAPEQPAPVALVALQQRLVQANVDGQAANPRVSKIDRSVAQSGGDKPLLPTVEPVAGTLEGCSNGCCDREWLMSLSTCYYTGWDNRWFLFNYGYSWANSGDIANFRGLVCSATGTSTWAVNIDSYNLAFKIKEATYRTWYWTAGTSFFCGGTCGEDLTTTVNNSSDRHLHTYCGMVQKD